MNFDGKSVYFGRAGKKVSASACCGASERYAAQNRSSMCMGVMEVIIVRFSQNFRDFHLCFS